MEEEVKEVVSVSFDTAELADTAFTLGHVTFHCNVCGENHDSSDKQSYQDCSTGLKGKILTEICNRYPFLRPFLELAQYYELSRAFSNNFLHETIIPTEAKKYFEVKAWSQFVQALNRAAAFEPCWLAIHPDKFVDTCIAHIISCLPEEYQQKMEQSLHDQERSVV